MNNRDFWNTRYAATPFVYGTEPNAFLVEHRDMLRSPVLSICEGEGRNAVYLAESGLEVLGVDLSEVALKKADALARSRGVVITTSLADLTTYEPRPNHYGAVVSIWAHLPSSVRHRLYPLLERALTPGGILLLESYSESQLEKDTGGPKDADMLMTVEKVRREFPTLEPVLLRETEREVHEGGGHSGMSSVVQFIGRRPDTR
ncbi:MAG: class I SAM-dependent methyltransferase [Gemmatimonadaceae bacterium]